jgi:hypothetical protein
MWQPLIDTPVVGTRFLDPKAGAGKSRLAFISNGSRPAVLADCDIDYFRFGDSRAFAGMRDPISFHQYSDRN